MTKLDFKMPSTNLKLPALPRISFSQFRLPAGVQKLIEKAPFHKSQTLLLVEVGEEWLKYAILDLKGKQKSIIHLGSETIKDLGEYEIGQKINEFLKKTLMKPGEIYILHPTQNLTIRFLSLPSTDPKEIKDIIELQAVKQTPYSREEITADFRILETDPSGYSHVLLAISHRDVTSRYVRITDMTQRIANRLAISLEGIWGWYRTVRGKESQEQKQIVLLLDVDWLSTDLLIFSGDKMAFARNIGIGARQLTEQGAVMQAEFIREIQRSIESGEAELKNEKITHIVLSGAVSADKDLPALLTRELNLPCEILTPKIEENLLSPEALAALKDAKVSFSGFLGVACQTEAPKINLLPPEVELRKGLESRARELGVLGILLLGLVMIVSLICFEKIYKKSAYADALRKEYEMIQKPAEEVERMVAKMKLASDQMNASTGFLDLLRDISEVIPTTIHFTSLQYDDKEKLITLRGISEEMSAVFQLLSTLEATPHLKFVKTRNVTKRKVEEKDVAEFEIVANFEEAGAATLAPKPSAEGTPNVKAAG